eukprot:TRINITY_DN20138_c0_g1_i1.p1 TRINITY_DN20138_c0_g1~~TRINITY_DN20138_c0_g1_i1.p1  ORF type:complete len:368 (-),score=69.68 TRINITY_DN20138_c0_g1_i1:305-1384(-)
MSFDEPFAFEKTAGYLPWGVQEKYKGTHKNSDQFVLGLVHQEYARLLSTKGEAAAQSFCVSEGLQPSIMRQAYEAGEQLRRLLKSDALGALDLSNMVDDDENMEPSREQNYTAIRDWAQHDWQWGAIMLLLATALPHVAVHQEKRHIWVSDDQVGAVHKGSINCNKGGYVFPSPLFAFLDQVKEGGWKPPRCRQLTNLPPLLAILRPFAAGEIRLDDSSRPIIAGWIPLGPTSADSVKLLLALRLRLEDAVVEAADAIAQQGGSAFSAAGGYQDQELISLLRDILSHNSLRYKESHNSPAVNQGSWTANNVKGSHSQHTWQGSKGKGSTWSKGGSHQVQKGGWKGSGKGWPSGKSKSKW